MSREWYRFFFNLFKLTGGGTNDTSLTDLQIGPPPINEVLGELGTVYNQAQIASMMAQYEQSAREVINQLETSPASPQIGTIAAYNLDGIPIAGGVSYGTGSALAVTPAGTTGQLLTSAGNAPPTWTTLSSVVVTSFSAGTTGLTPAVATAGAVTLAGTLAVANGGTGVTTSTGTGSVVLSTSPILVTPTLGVASATSVDFGLGAAAIPSITFTGDLNTGIWSPAADTIAASTGGAERMRITSAGEALIGSATATNNARVNQKLGVVSVGSGSYGGGNFTTYGGTSADICSLVDFQRSRGTTDGSLTAVASGDRLGYLTWRGADGAAFQNAAAIRGEVDATPGLNDMPGRLVFLTTTDGTTTLAERMRIDSAGNVGIGTTASLSKLSVAGPIALQSPSTVNAATYSVAVTDSSLRFTTTNCTVTLPTASSFPGRILYLNTITANSVTSASANVIPLGSNTAGTAILAATAGKFAMLQSDGTNWITMLAN
jgi:hypothetical protein